MFGPQGGTTPRTPRTEAAGWLLSPELSPVGGPGNTNAPAIMIGERCAAFLLAA